MTLNKLPYVQAAQPIKEALKYIDDRRTGRSKSLKTRWSKFNKLCMGGFEPGSLYTIGGISGSGKSSFVNTLQLDLCELNDTNEFVVLNFSFEMLNEKQIGRMLSYKMQKTTNELYSANLNETNEHLSDDDYNNATMYAKQIERYPLYFIDRPGTVDEIEATISYFQETFKDKWLIVILDHTLLTKSKPGADERTTLADLQRVFIKAKKIGKTTIIQLSQLNREIESVDRLQNPSMQYPTRRDIFGGESVYQASDWVLILHRPEILGITCYGVKKLPTKDMIYLHCIKAREGEPKILSFYNNLKYNSIEEINISNT